MSVFTGSLYIIVIVSAWRLRNFKHMREVIFDLLQLVTVKMEVELVSNINQLYTYHDIWKIIQCLLPPWVRLDGVSNSHWLKTALFLLLFWAGVPVIVSCIPQTGIKNDIGPTSDCMMKKVHNDILREYNLKNEIALELFGSVVSIHLSFRDSNSRVLSYEWFWWLYYIFWCRYSNPEAFSWSRTTFISFFFRLDHF